MDLLCVRPSPVKDENLRLFVKAKGLPALGKLLRRCLDLRGGFKSGTAAAAAAGNTNNHNRTLSTTTTTTITTTVPVLLNDEGNQRQDDDALSNVAGTVELLVEP
jgi:hypothetical protein